MKHFYSVPSKAKSGASRFTLLPILLPVILAFGALTAAPTALYLEEAIGLDWLFTVRGQRPPPDDVVVVAISSQAAQNLALPLPSHWSRTVYAEVIDKLQQANARSIVLDIAFRNNRSDEEDNILAEAINGAGNVILFKYLKRRQLTSNHGLVDIEEEIAPPDAFTQGAAAIGVFTLPTYADRVYRTQLYHNLAEGVEAAQPLLALLFRHRKEAEDLYLWMHEELGLDSSGTASLQAMSAFFYQQFSAQPRLAKELLASQKMADDDIKAGLVYALSLIEPIHINYYGPYQSLPTTDIDHVLSASAEELRSLFADKTVYIGYSDDSQTEQRDSHPTVFSGTTGVNLSGVEISATVLANLVDQSVIQPPARWLWLWIVVGAMVIAAVSAWRLRFWQSAVLQISVSTSYTFAAAFFFSRYALWLPLAIPLGAAFCANLVAFSTHYYRGKRREAHAIHSLEQYLPRNAARELGASLVDIEKRHRIVHGVCMMSDIEGYTSLSESCEPDELHDLMNRYYSVLIEEVNKQDGMVVNIVGDSLLALWIGPEITADLCERACVTVLNIANRIDSLDEFCAKLPTCFALHGGLFSLGNLGAAGHFEYSPVGDIINTTARIEKANRTLGTQKLMSDVVVQNLPQSFQRNLSVRPLGSFSLRNKSQAIPLSTFEYARENGQAEEAALRSSFDRALKHYEEGDKSVARALFTELVHRYPNDGPSRYYLLQCATDR